MTILLDHFQTRVKENKKALTELKTQTTNWPTASFKKHFRSKNIKLKKKIY